MMASDCFCACGENGAAVTVCAGFGADTSDVRAGVKLAELVRAVIGMPPF